MNGVKLLNEPYYRMTRKCHYAVQQQDRSNILHNPASIIVKVKINKKNKESKYNCEPINTLYNEPCNKNIDQILVN